MGFARSIIIWLAFAAASFAGPYADEYGGIEHATGAVFRGWVSGYVEFVQPDPASGGYARNDSGQVCAISNSIVGRPAAFDAGSTAQHVLSLGNGGSIVLGFERAIEDGSGPDFAVFENGFTDYTDFAGSSRADATNSFSFAELAFVEVATRTSAWARFPVACLNTSVLHNLNNASEDRFASQDVTLLDGVAGKHRIEFGTPFDLSALTNHPSVLSGEVDLRCIRYVRLTDVIGDGSTTDSLGRAVYDPYYNFSTGYPNPPFAASTDGFDLRGVGVIHFAGVKVKATPQGANISWFAETNASYQVQWSLLDGPTWNDVGSPVVGDDGMHSITDSTPATVRLYRVVENRGGGQ
jgi:hypothetical protein